MLNAITYINRDSRLALLATLALPILFWGILVKALSYEWIQNSQYTYGWAILAVISWLVWKRSVANNEIHPVVLGVWARVILALALLSWAMVQILKEANPEWRFAFWAETVIVITLTYFYCLMTGGRGLWGRLLPCLCIFLTAVPWPTPVENLLVSNFTSWITAGVTETLHLMGISATSQGNVIKLLNGFVGVEEACSGIRSFQLSLALSVLLTVIFRLSLHHGAFCVMMGALLAFVLNFFRTLGLTWIYSQSGDSGYNHWHDPLGLVVQLLLVGGLWFFAHAYSRQDATTASATPDFHLIRLPVSTCLWMVIFVLGTMGFKEMWYGYREKASQGQPRWDVRWQNDPRFKEERLSQETLSSLKSSYSKQVIFSEGSKEWTMFFMKWNPGKDSIRASRAHNPTICLPASGFKLRSKGYTFLPCRGLMMPFETFTFEANQRIYYVFYCLWEDTWTFPAAETQHSLQRADRWWRLQVAWQGKRNLGQQALEVAMTGYTSFEEASSALAQQLPKLINISK